MIVVKKPVVSLVVPCHSGKKEIKKCLDSVIDQDYKDFEAIVVVNGKYDEREAAIKQIKSYKDDRIKLVELDEGNVCNARNVGAKQAQGDYISFFSSDFYMYPGALTKWVETFKAHPEADFIYSGYRLMRDGEVTLEYVPSFAFDPWQLKMGNYIDGGFPMRRKVSEACEWDVNCKSLNDWDFWLTAIDKGFKGYYMLDVTYAAEFPKTGGLSHDSHKNWIERVTYIKKKHNIPINDICVVSLGAQPHAKNIAKILKADFQVAPQLKPHNYKAIYLIGFYIGDGDSAIAHSNVFRGAPNDCKKVIHWIGTDVMQLVGAGYRVCFVEMKQLIDVINRCVNLSEFEQTKNELELCSLHSKILALPIEPLEVMPLPKKQKVAVYAPSTPTARQIYNLDFTMDLIKSCPDINFVLFGGGLTELKLPNVENYGWCEMKKVIENTSLLLRLTFHDGLPITPIEFRMAGRDAIATVNMPFVHYAGQGNIHEQNFAERKEVIVKLLRDVLKEQKKHGIKDLDKARNYYLDLTNPRKFRKRFLKTIGL